MLDPFAPTPRARHAHCLPACPPPAEQVHTREDQYHQARATVHSQYPSQTGASPEVVLSLRPGVVDHKELHDAPDNQEHREQPAHSRCGKPRQLPSLPWGTFPPAKAPLLSLGRHVRCHASEDQQSRHPLARQVPSPGAPTDARNDQPLRTAVVDSRPAKIPCEGSATGTPEVDSAGDSVRTETIFTRDHQPGRKTDRKTAFSPAHLSAAGYPQAWAIPHVDPAGYRTAQKYSNAVGRERLRQAAAERVTFPNDRERPRRREFASRGRACPLRA
jgi:hypothetical protein